MDYVKSVGSFIRRTYNNINPATLSGAIDIIVCENEETGEMVTSPFHVRFGKLGVLSPKEKVINISVNGERIEDIQMKLGEQGEAFFVTETQRDEQVPLSYVTSPMPTSPMVVSPENSRPTSPNKPERQRRKKHKRRSLDEIERLAKDSNSDSESGDIADLELSEFDPEL